MHTDYRLEPANAKQSCPGAPRLLCSSQTDLSITPTRSQREDILNYTTLKRERIITSPHVETIHAGPVRLQGKKIPEKHFPKYFPQKKKYK